jgi:hypothetical protein
MPKESNIVHQYFKKESPEVKLLVRVNPLQFKVMEITVPKTGEPTVEEQDVDQEIINDLKADGFIESSPLEFNLYFSGLIG